MQNGYHHIFQRIFLRILAPVKIDFRHFFDYDIFSILESLKTIYFWRFEGLGLCQNDFSKRKASDCIYQSRTRYQEKSFWIRTMYHGYVSWLCIMAMYHDSVSWLCIMTMHHGYVSWLCIMAMYHGYVSWLCIMTMHLGYVSWLCIMAMYHGYVSWLCILAMYLGSASLFLSALCIVIPMYLRIQGRMHISGGKNDIQFLY